MNLKDKIREYKKELILKKAGEFLEKNGFEKSKMADIAAHCGISVGALYNFFSSKDELFYEYVKYQIDTFVKNLKKGFERIESPRERLEFFVKLKFETFKSKVNLLKDTVAGDPLFFAKLNANKGNPALKIYEILAKEFEKMENLKTDDYIKLACLFHSFTFGYIEYWLNYDQHLDKFAQEACDFFIKGIVK
ncbi:TetR/AcrR family transcriptional regulator [Nitrosophilus labii]|uniref:TetR/AcrR family transcriptional regulator n=1 Tax=Nitrosophilus labii TaxID=2706014 RepID=UPI001656D8EB|nr:TetR/AcrR family transcriptional regulator [Nitrosophilus labii]